MKKFILNQKKDLLCECQGSIFITNVPGCEALRCIVIDVGFNDYNLGTYTTEQANEVFALIIDFLNRKGTLSDGVFSMPAAR